MAQHAKDKDKEKEDSGPSLKEKIEALDNIPRHLKSILLEIAELLEPSKKK